METSASSTKLPIFTVDAFTRVPFCGNPAAVVCLQDDAEISDRQKQAIAAEMKLSETAFVSKKNPQDDFSTARRFKLRWFTPEVEVPLCGHATLATAVTIFRELGNTSAELEFDTMSGVLKASKGDDGTILLNMPAVTTEPVKEEKTRELVQAVVGHLPVCEVRYSPELKKLLVRLDDSCTSKQLKQFTPSPARMLQFDSKGQVKGVIVTLRGTQSGEMAKYDFLSRYFSPWYGIPEDPVTGSAHAVLGPYWASILGKNDLLARQTSARGGDLYIRISSSDPKRLLVGGHAATVLRGELQL